MTALLCLDTQTGRVRRYVSHDGRSATLSHSCVIDQWNQVLSGRVGIDPERLDEYRRAPTFGAIA